jgi:hypothetical protein
MTIHHRAKATVLMRGIRSSCNPTSYLLIWTSAFFGRISACNSMTSKLDE